MSKKVLIISGSPRKNGNSDILCDEFARGAIESGNEVEKISLSQKKVGYCIACDYCQAHNGQCVMKDDMGDILQSMITADVIVMASPVYFYSIDAQLKAIIDRCVARYTEIKNKQMYFIMTAAEDEEQTFEGTKACFQGFLDCLPNSTEKASICAGGVWQKGEIKGSKYVKQAYELGKNV